MEWEERSNVLFYLGATKEGVLRSFNVGKDNTTHDATLYSIIQSEWFKVKTRMRAKIVEKLTVQTEAAKQKLKEAGLLEQYTRTRAPVCLFASYQFSWVFS